MRFFNRLCIFLLGFVMGIVGCIGGLAGGVYYAYTGLKIEDFTGVLTKDQVPVLDEDSKNITQMSMQEILEKVMMLNNISEITIANLETTFGLDFSSLKLPDEVKQWPLSKLFEEDGFRQFADYVTLGAVYDLVTDTLEVDFLAENYEVLFGEGGKLREVTLGDFLEEDGYITALAGIRLIDLIPSSVLADLPDYLKALLDAVGAVSLSDLLSAIIKGEGDILQVILDTPEVKALLLSDIFPEGLEGLKKMLEGIRLGDIVRYEEGGVIFDSDALLKALTVYDVLCLVMFLDLTPEELLEMLPEGEVRDRLEVIINMSLYEIGNEAELRDFIGDLTIGGVVDTVLKLLDAEDAINDLPAPIPVIWNKLKTIQIMEILDGINEDDFSFLLEDRLYTLTIEDLFGSYLNDEALANAPEPVPGIWHIIKSFTIGFIVNDYADIPSCFDSYTLMDMLGGYFYEGEYVIDPETGERRFVAEMKSGKEVAKVEAPLGDLFALIKDISFGYIVKVVLCELDACGHEDESEHYTLEQLLEEHIYGISIGDILDPILYDEDGNFIAPHTVEVIYQAIRDNTIGDIIAVANGEAGYEELLENLYKLCLDDLVGVLIDFDQLPVLVLNIYNKIAFISIGEIVEDWEVVLRALYTITIDDLVGEFIDREALPAAVVALYDCVKDISVQSVIDAMENKEYYKLYEGFYNIGIIDLLESDAFDGMDSALVYLLESTFNISFGFLAEFVLCQLDVCLDEGVVRPGHEHIGLYAFLDESIFSLEISELLYRVFTDENGNPDEVLDYIGALLDALRGLTLGELFYAIVYELGPQAVESLGLEDRAVMGLFDLALKYLEDYSLYEIFKNVLESEDYYLVHPLQFIVLSLSSLTFGEIVELVEQENWVAFVDAAERCFADFIHSDYFEHNPELVIYINEAYPVSLSFLLGYYYDYVTDIITENITEDAEDRAGLRKMFDVVFRAYADITVRDIYMDWEVLVDALNKFTMSDLLADLLGFTYENGVWVNSDASATSNALFNAFADITPYDLIFDMDYTMVLYNFKLDDLKNLFLDALDPTREQYGKLPYAVRQYLENVGQITFGEVIDGAVDGEYFIDALGEIDLGDLFEIITLLTGFELPDNHLLNKIFAIKLIDLVRFDEVKLLQHFTVYDFIKGFLIDLAGVSLDMGYSFIYWLLTNMDNVTLYDFYYFAQNADDVTLEELVRKLLKGLTIEVLVDTICEIIQPYDAHPELLDTLSLWKNLAPLEVADFIYDIEGVEQALEDGLKQTSVGEVIKLVLDLIDSQIFKELPSIVQKLILNLCRIEFSFYSLIDNAVNGAPSDYAETLVKAFLADIVIDDIVDLFKDGVDEDLKKIFDTDLYKRIGGIYIADIIFDTEKVLDTLSATSVGEVVTTVFVLLEYDYENLLPQGTLNIISKLNNLTIKFFMDNADQPDFIDRLLEALFDGAFVGDYLATVYFIMYGTKDESKYHLALLVVDDFIGGGDILGMIRATNFRGFMQALFNGLTIGDAIVIIDNRFNTGIEGSAFDRYLDPFRPISLALLLSAPTPDEFFGIMTYKDIFGRDIELILTSEQYNAFIADDVNDFFDMLPENFRVYATLGVAGVAVAVVVIIMPYNVDDVVQKLGISLPALVANTTLYRVLAFISLEDYMKDPAAVKAAIDSLTVGDEIRFLMAVLGLDYIDFENDPDYPLLVKLFENADNMQAFPILRALVNGTLDPDAIEALKQLLLNITVDDVVKSTVGVYFNLQKIVYDCPLYMAIQDIYLNDLITSTSETIDQVITNVYAITVGSIVRWLHGLFNFTLDESQVLFGKLMLNLDQLDIKFFTNDYDTLYMLRTIFYNITYKELIEGILELAGADKTNLPDEAELLVDTLLDNAGSLYVSALFNDPMSADWYAALEGVTLGMIIEAVCSLFGVHPDSELTSGEPLKSIWAIELRQLIDDFENTVASLGDISLGAIIDTFIKYFGADSVYVDYPLIEKLVNNSRLITLNNLYKVITGQSGDGAMTVTEFMQALLRNIYFNDIYLTVTKATGYSLPDEIVASDLVSAVLSIPVYGIIFQTQFTVERYLYPISVGDVIELVLIIAPDFTIWSQLQKLIDNANKLTVKLFVDYANNKVTLVQMLSFALDGLNFNLILESPLGNYIPNRFDKSDLVTKLALIEFYDILYNRGEVNTVLANVTLRDVAVMLVDGFAVQLYYYDIINKLITNATTVSLFDVMSASSASEFADIIRKLIHEIAVSDVLSIPSIDGKLSDTIKNSAVYTQVASLTFEGLIFDTLNELVKLADITVGDIVELVLQIAGVEWVASNYIILGKLLNNAKTLTVNQTLQAFTGTTIAAAAVSAIAPQAGPVMTMREYMNALLGDIDLEDLYNDITDALNVGLPQEIESSSLFDKLGSVTFFGLIFDINGVISHISTITIGETVKPFIDLFAPEIMSYTLAVKLVDNASKVSLYGFIVNPGDLEENVKIILNGIVLGDALELVDSRLPDEIRNSEVYTLLSGLTFEGLIFDTLNECAIMATSSIGGIIEVLLALVNTDIASQYATLATLLANLKTLNIDQAVQAFAGIRLIASSDSLMTINEFCELALANVNLRLVINDVLAAFTMVLTNEISTSSLYTKLSAVGLYELLFDFEGVYNRHLRALSVGDVVDFALIFLPSFNSWAQLDLFIRNLHVVTLGVIVEVANGTITVQELLNMALRDISFKIVAEIPALSEVVPDWLEYSSIYDKLTDIEIYDAIYDKDSALNVIKGISVGDVTELVITNTIPEWVMLKLISKLNGNLKLVALYDLFTANFDPKTLINTVLDDITLGDIVQFVGFYYIPVAMLHNTLALIGDAMLIRLLSAADYTAFIRELVGTDATLCTLLQAVGADFPQYNVYLMSDVVYYVSLFHGARLYEILTNPTPSVLFGNVTLGQLVGRVLGWTPTNANETIWVGTGMLAPYANTTLVELIQMTIGMVIQDELLQTALFAAAAAALAGVYLLYKTNEANIIAYLDKTVDEALIDLDLMRLAADRTTVLGAVIGFISDNYGSRTLSAMYNYIVARDLQELLNGVTIGEVYDLVDILTSYGLTTFVDGLTDIKDIVNALINCVRNADLGLYIAADTFAAQMNVLFGNATVYQAFALINNNGVWYLNADTRFPSQDIANMLMRDFIGYFESGNALQLLYRWDFIELYQMIDPNMDKFSGEDFGSIIYKIVNANAATSVGDIYNDLVLGDLSRFTSVLTLGDLADLIPDNLKQDMPFIVTILDRNKDLRLDDLAESPDILNVLLGDIRVGEIMLLNTDWVCTLSHDHGDGTDCRYIWKDDNDIPADAIANQLANLKAADLFEGGLNTRKVLGNITIGELINLYSREENGVIVWYNDENFEYPVDILIGAIAGIQIADAMDNHDLILGAVDLLFVGELMGFTKQGDTWYDGTDEVEALIANVANFTVGELRGGNFTISQVFGDMLLGELLGYELIWLCTDTHDHDINTCDHEWRNGATSVDALFAALSDVKVNDLLSNFDFEQFIKDKGIKLGDIMGYELHDFNDGNGPVWADYDSTNGYTKLDKVTLKLCDIALGDIMTPGFDFITQIEDLYIGDLMNYYQDAAGNWYEDEQLTLPLGQKLKIALANTQLKDILNPNFDLTSIFAGLKVGEVLGYELNALSNWEKNGVEVDNNMYEAFLNTEMDDLLDPSFDFTTIFAGMKLGDIMGYELHDFNDGNGPVWAKLDKTQNPAVYQKVTEKVTLKIIDLDMSTVLDIDNPFDFTHIFNDMYLGEAMGNELIWNCTNSEPGHVHDINTCDHDWRLGGEGAALEPNKLLKALKDTMMSSIIGGGTLNLSLVFSGLTVGDLMGGDAATRTPLEASIAAISLPDLMDGNVDIFDSIQGLTLNEVLGISNPTGILSSLGDLKISELQDETKLNQAINNLTVSDIFSGTQLQSGILSLIPSDTTLSNLPNALANAVPNATYNELSAAGIVLITEAQLTTLLDFVNFTNRTSTTMDEFMDQTYADIIEAVITAIRSVPTLP